MTTVNRRSVRTVLAGLALAGLCHSSAHAATITWDGDLSDAWNAASFNGATWDTNWDNDGGPAPNFPTALDTVVFSGPSPNTSIDMSSDVVVGDIRFDGGTSVYTLGAVIGQRTITLSTGDLGVTGTFNTPTVNSNVNIGADGTWDVSSVNTITMNGEVQGGTLTKTGTGSLILTNNNSHAATRVENGTLTITHQNQLGVSGSVTTLAGGELTFNAAVNTGGSRPITLEGDANGISTGGNDVEWSSVISGTGGFTKFFTGTLTLDAANTYTGTTTISQGTLQIGNGGAGGDIAGDIINNSALIVNRDGSFTNAVSGTGTVDYIAPGTTTIDGSNAFSYSGLTTFSGGVLELDRTGTPAVPGDFTIASGTVNMLRDNQIADTSTVTANGDLNMNGISDNVAAIAVGNGATVGLSNGASLLGTTLNVTGAGTSVDVNGSTLTLIGNANITDGGVSLDASSLLFSIDRTLTLNGSAALFEAVNGSTIGVDSPVPQIGLGLVVNDGTFTLSADSSYNATGQSNSGDVDLNGGTADFAGAVSVRGLNVTLVGSGPRGGDLNVNGAAVTVSNTWNARGGNGNGFNPLSADGGRGGNITVSDGSLSLDTGANFNLQGGNGSNGGEKGAPGSVIVTGGTLILNEAEIRGASDAPTADPVDLIGSPMNISGTGLVRLNGDMTAHNAPITVDSATLDASGRRLATGTPGHTLTLNGPGVSLDVLGTGLVDLRGGDSFGDGNDGAAAGQLQINNGAASLQTGSRIDLRGGSGDVQTNAVAPLNATGGNGGLLNIDGGLLDLTAGGTVALAGGPGGVGQNNFFPSFGLQGGAGGNGGTLNLISGSMTLDGNAVINVSGGAGGVGGSTCEFGFPSPICGPPTGASGVRGTAGSVNISGGTTTLISGLITGFAAETPDASDPIILYKTDLNITGGAVTAQNTLGIEDTAVLSLSGGSLVASAIREVTGGDLLFTGGTLSPGAFVGDLTQDGGTLAPGTSPGASLGATVVTGNYDLNAGSLAIELAGNGGAVGTDFDYLDVTGDLTLAGTLDVSLFGGHTPAIGDSYFIITSSGTRSGTFDTVNLPSIPGVGLSLEYVPNLIRLITELAGDLNGDGFVGIDDLNIVLGAWNQNVTAGIWSQGDPSGDGFIGIDDLNTVLGNWNAGAPPPIGTANIPEPASLSLLLGSLLVTGRSRRG